MMIVDTRGNGRTGDIADYALNGCDGSMADRRVIIQVLVEFDLLFAQLVESVLDSLRSDLETDDGVGCRLFQS